MGATMLLPITLSLLLGTINALPLEDFRSNLEFLDYSTNVDEPRYRLLDNVQPRYMTVDLDVYLAESRFNGLVQIDVEVLEANLTQIVLHQNVVRIVALSVLDTANNPIPLRFPDAFTTDSYYELLEINFADPISVGNYSISISYLGQINENPVDRGFYKGYYYYQNVKREYATTQFQPYHARKAFPCFDEPQFKSRFVISITRDNNLSPSYSNMPIGETQLVAPGRVRETFLPTPIVSVYLIAFHVSDFIETGFTSTPEKPFSIISRLGVINQHQYAAQIGLEITNKLDEYFGINYYEMGQGQPMKNDHIALPDFPSGAMENWGMVNYSEGEHSEETSIPKNLKIRGHVISAKPHWARMVDYAYSLYYERIPESEQEAYLLYDPDNTNRINQIFIATIMAHELAHKWFGNLVTCFWWSNLWLNESFASFFEYFGAHYADAELELDDQFVVDYVHSALTWDAGSGATPMNWSNVVDNPSVTSHFSTTSYAKGASVLRMVEHLVDPQTFRTALSTYLRDNAYGIGRPTDLYAAFRTAVQNTDFATRYPNIDIGNLMDSWVQTPGSPVLDVVVDMSAGSINVTQRRYQLSGTPHQLIWQIPISWTDSASLSFTSTKPNRIMTERSISIETEPGHRFVIFNIAQSGLYRVNYDDHNWEMIAAYLRNNRENIHKLNRAQIVNDILFFIRTRDISMARAFDVLSFLKDETDYYVWNGAITQLDWIRRRLEHMPAVHDEFTAYLLEIMENVIQHVGYNDAPNESTSTTLNRIQILNYACNILGHEGCIQDSLEKWEQFRQNETNLVPKNLRRHVYCVGLREGDAADYNFLFRQYNTSENTADMVVILRALACTKEQSLITHYLSESQFNDRIRIHDRTNAFSFALLGNKENVPTVLNYLYQNFQSISDTYGGPARLTIAINSLAAYLTDFAHITQFQTWLYANQLAIPESFNAGVGVINTSINNLEWGNTNAVEMFSTLRGRSAAGSIVASVTLLFVVISAHLLR